MNILVLCTGNSARSILLESIFNTLGKGRVKAFSAGSQPAGKVHPQSITLLESLGHDISVARSKSCDEFGGPDAPRMDIVITVCASAAGETCPVWAGAPVRTHWGVEDPAAAVEADWEDAFETAYKILKKRAEAFLALGIERLNQTALISELKRIGALV